MFEELEGNGPRERKKTDWTGTIIGVCLLPVFFFFVYLGKPELGFTTVIVLGMALIAVYLRWKLRRHIWFWLTVICVLLIHIPFLTLIHWPQTNMPTIAYSMPFGIADFLIMSGALTLAQRIFLKESPAETDSE